MLPQEKPTSVNSLMCSYSTQTKIERSTWGLQNHIIGNISILPPTLIFYGILTYSYLLRITDLSTLLHWFLFFTISTECDRGLLKQSNISGVLCQEQVSRAGTSNYIPQFLWGVITWPFPLQYSFSCCCHTCVLWYWLFALNTSA